MQILLLCQALLLVGIGAHAHSENPTVREAWEKFKAEHGKAYLSEAEEAFRLKVFKESLFEVERHNARYDSGKVTFRVAINRNSDQLPHEVAERLNGFRTDLAKPRRPQQPPQPEPQLPEDVPRGWSWPWPWPWPFPWPWGHKSVDWRKKGYVTGVKDQGQCGSCWAFSTTGSLEGQLFKKTGQLVSLSEQNLVDCSGDYGNYGCSGGLMDQAFQYIKDNGGIDTENSYPYTAQDGSCSYSATNTGGTDTGYVDVNPTEADLQVAVKNIGPISVAIDASKWSFQQYASGIYYEESCSSDQLDHGVLLVGYGSDGSGKDYWLVKNSWGTSWGEQGYIKMARNKNNNCGIATQASYPTV